MNKHEAHEGEFHETLEQHESHIAHSAEHSEHTVHEKAVQSESHPIQTPKKGFQLNSNTLFYILAAVLLVIAATSIFKINPFASNTQTAIPTNNNVNNQLTSGELTLTIITANSCKQCFDISGLATAMQQSGISLTTQNVDYSTDKGKQLIAKYGITKLPNAILTGSIANLSQQQQAAMQQAFKQDGDALTLAVIPAPYLDVATGNLVGKVSIIELKDNSCKDCFDVTKLSQILNESGVYISDLQSIDRTSKGGKDLIAKYAIAKLPTIILSSDAMAYPQIAGQWNAIGTQEKDGSLIMRQLQPPYEDLATGNVEGLVSRTDLVDKTCKDCFNASLLDNLVTALSLTIVKHDIFDVSSSSGIALVKKYNITQIPTLILSKEASVYPTVKQAWTEIGSVESDGSYVFRNLTMVNKPYKDLTTGKIVNQTTA